MIQTHHVPAALRSTAPRFCEVATELLELVRQVARVVRCREWLRRDVIPAEARSLESMGLPSVRLVADTVKGLGRPGGWLGGPADSPPMKGEAEELYDRGVAGIFAEPMDPVELLRRKALYDLLLGLLLSCDRALETVRTAYLP